ncbi:type II CAAX prenyl endopeptidase Rce1 family protein [Actinocorallia sp. API 0066]|uniref:CPBP family glutamic-type intramembrane protease n=1 Tax=Actinocorallia sp. API 0066 TaxID=2896846 RepID=UPI0027DFDCE8|nr:CPBP family glutamic-type intramembrane protease [Actinocorallia sp. API 0066]
MRPAAGAPDDEPAPDAATSWVPVDARPSFGPPEPQATWPAEHTYPLRHVEQPPPPPGTAPESPGYTLPTPPTPATPGYRLPAPTPTFAPVQPPPYTPGTPSPYTPPLGHPGWSSVPPGVQGPPYAQPPTAENALPGPAQPGYGPVPPSSHGSPYEQPPTGEHAPPGPGQPAWGPVPPGVQGPPYAQPPTGEHALPEQGQVRPGFEGSPYRQPPTGEHVPPAYGQPGYGQPPTGEHVLPGYRQPGYGPVPSGVSGSPYGQPPTGEHVLPGYGQAGYGTGAYGGPGPYGGVPYAGGPGYVVAGYGRREPWVVEPEAGVPFHRMDRTRVHRWWRPLLGTLALAGLIFFAAIMVFVLWAAGHWAVTGEQPKLGADGNQLFGGVVEDLAAQLVMIGVWTPLVLLVVWGVARRPAGGVVSVLGRMRWKWLAVCVLPALGYVVLSYALLVLVSAVFGADEPAAGQGGWVGWSALIAPLVVIILFVPFQSAAEEFVFRGWLLQAIGGCTLVRPDGTYRNGFTRALGAAFGTPWPAIVISSAVFVAGHGYTGWAMLDIGLWAVTCGWLTVKTGGLEASIALHVLNNLVAFGVPAVMGQLDDALVQGGAPAYILLADLPPLVFFAVVVLWLRRRMDVATLTPGPAGEPPADERAAPALQPSEG